MSADQLQDATEGTCRGCGHGIATAHDAEGECWKPSCACPHIPAEHETYTFLSADGYKWSCSCSDGVFHGAFTRRRDADEAAERHMEAAR